METVLIVIALFFIASKMRGNKAAAVTGASAQDVPVKPLSDAEASYKPAQAVVTVGANMPSISEVARRFIGVKPNSERSLESTVARVSVQLAALQSEVHPQELVCFTLPVYRTDSKAKPCLLVITDQRIGLAGETERRWWPISRVGFASNLGIVSGNPVADFFNISKDPSWDRIEVKIPGDPFGNRFYSYSSVRTLPVLDFLKSRISSRFGAFPEYLLPKWTDQIPVFYGHAEITYKSGNLPASNEPTEISNLVIGEKCALIVDLDGTVNISRLKNILRSSLNAPEIQITSTGQEHILNYKMGSQYGEFSIETTDIALAAMAYQTALKAQTNH
jgi:hypothetical protein